MLALGWIKTEALTMTVAANVKQILMTVLGVMFWGLEVGRINGLKIFVYAGGRDMVCEG